jgi:hypothetical protein
MGLGTAGLKTLRGQNMSIRWYNLVGAGLDMVGIVLIWIFSQKNPGILTPAAIKLSRHIWWLEIGIFLIALGVTVQLLGNLLS